MDLEQHTGVLGAEWLDCPVCEAPCSTLPPYRPSSDMPFPYWCDGDSATCQCGAVVFVEADGEQAWLVEHTPGESGQ